IVRRLRRELKREVHRAEQLMTDGGRLIMSVLSQDGRLSPLGCYIAAQSLGRADIAEQFAGGAVEQHHGCPLYKVASVALLPPDRCPLDAAVAAAEAAPVVRSFKKSIVMN